MRVFFSGQCMNNVFARTIFSRHHLPRVGQLAKASHFQQHFQRNVKTKKMDKETLWTRFQKSKFVILLRQFDSWQAKYTLLGCILFSSLKASGADAVVQFFQMNEVKRLRRELRDKEADERSYPSKPTFDWPRHLAFVSFGLLYGGIFQYFIFNRLLPFIWPARSIVNNIKAALFDVTLHMPFVYLPTFYIVREFIFTISDSEAAVNQRGVKNMKGRPMVDPDAKPQEYSFDAQHIFWRTIYHGLHEYSLKMVEDSLASFKIFAPAHVVTFGLLPQHFRVPWLLAVGFGWVCYLSATNRGSKEHQKVHLQLEEVK